MPNATKELAEFASSVTLEDIPTDVIDHANTMIIDTIGVMLVGAQSDSVQIAKKKTEKIYQENVDTGSNVIGTSWKFPSEQAAFLNGVSSHALDFDDVHKEMGGHPSAPILPSILSVAQQISADGKDVIRSFIIGVETELVLAAILNPSHYDRGWHPTSIFGHIGASTSVGSLLDFDVEEIQKAIGIATSQASGVKGNFGTMTKPYHVGKAARSGIEASRLVESGFTAKMDILELDFGGYFDLYKGEDGYDFANHFTNLGSKWRLLDPPVNFKEYPCCGSTHVPIDVARELRKEPELDIDDIDSVRITEHPRRLAHTNIPKPSTELEGKFSVQYVVSKALMDGSLWLDDFTDTAVNDPKIQEFLQHVKVNQDESLSDDQDRYARLDIDVNGETFSHEINNRRLRGKDEVHKKFRKCVESSSINTDGNELLAKMESFEEISNLQGLIQKLTI